MATIETIQNQIEEGKAQLKFAKCVEVIFEAFGNKDEFQFEAFGRKIKLFSSEHLMSCGKLNIRMRQILHFEEMYFITFDIKTTQTKQLKSAIRFYDNNYETHSQVFWSMLRELEK